MHRDNVTTRFVFAGWDGDCCPDEPEPEVRKTDSLVAQPHEHANTCTFIHAQPHMHTITCMQTLAELHVCSNTCTTARTVCCVSHKKTVFEQKLVVQACEQKPFVAGTCKAAIPRWSLNPDTGNCEEFSYGGCDANANNFESEKECVTTCNPTGPTPVCSPSPYLSLPLFIALLEKQETKTVEERANPAGNRPLMSGAVGGASGHPSVGVVAM